MNWIGWRVGWGGNRRDMEDKFALRNWMDSAVIYWDGEDLAKNKSEG